MAGADFTAAIQANEPAIRLGCFAVVLAAVAVWEALAPRRPRSVSRWERWPSNLALVAINGALVRLAFPIAAVGVAAIASAGGFGLLNAIPLPLWTATILGIVLLELAI